MNFTPCCPSQTRDALGKFVKKAIVHYRDDLDLQNLMDSIQKEVFPARYRFARAHLATAPHITQPCSRHAEWEQ